VSSLQGKWNSLMFVSIDMDNLVFLHKHADHDTLSALSFLETPDRSILVESTDRTAFLNKLSRLDLCVLYKNTTGAALVSEDTRILRWQLHDMIMLTPPTVAFREEVEAQVAAVEADLHAGKPYKYALGAKVPAAPQELFPLRCKPLTAAQLAGAAQAAPQALTHVPEAPTPPAPLIPAVKQRAVGVRPAVWGAADAAWEAAGKPTDMPTVLALRKTIMTQLLEEKGIKKSTSSNELGAWQKDRLA
jgi:hypothetical protein